ncbi:Hypothetical predicted protein [Olea europaea subsp. europaea]|uniref:Uncharacterized protein n=1 Tax=Olea europaea subsp. europaea TaxID=158383 RepID=A0A8S0VKL4_OLEEU|nr:Hypothetical predicted protein [Olea europaea subsp. europaea]
MRLRTMKLEIEHHVTSECKKLWEFLATLMAPAGRTMAAAATPVDIEVELSGRLPQDVYGGHIEPFLDKQDMRADTCTEHLQDGAHIAGRPDDDQDPMPAATDYLLDGGSNEAQLGMLDLNDRGAMEPSHAVPINDAEFEGCAITNGDGVVTKAPLPATVLEAGCAFPTMRRRSARLRRPAPSTRTPYTRGTKRTKK